MYQWNYGDCGVVFVSEDKCKEVTDVIDSFDDSKKKFALWYLLQDFIHDCELYRVDNIRDIKTKEEYACQVMNGRHLQAASEMREILGYELWG